MSLKDALFILLKSIFNITILIGLVFLGYYDYHLGISYCNFMNIPKDLAISVVSPGMAIEVGIVLFVFEIIGLYFIVKLLRRNKYIDNFCDFISIEM